MVNWRIEVDRLWRDPQARSNFEFEYRIAPLATDEAGLDLQKSIGYVELYHGAFLQWGLSQLHASGRL